MAHDVDSVGSTVVCMAGMVVIPTVAIFADNGVSSSITVSHRLDDGRI